MITPWLIRFTMEQYLIDRVYFPSAVNDAINNIGKREGFYFQYYIPLEHNERYRVTENRFIVKVPTGAATELDTSTIRNIKKHRQRMLELEVDGRSEEYNNVSLQLRRVANRKIFKNEKSVFVEG